MNVFHPKGYCCIEGMFAPLKRKIPLRRHFFGLTCRVPTEDTCCIPKNLSLPDLLAQLHSSKKYRSIAEHYEVLLTFERLICFFVTLFVVKLLTIAVPMISDNVSGELVKNKDELSSELAILI